jgi:hemerythrin-like domain-containing protein
MTGTPTFQRLSRRAIEEHQQIDFFLKQLMTSLKSLDAESEDVEPLRRLAAQIDSFRERLEEHFQHEEDDGLFQAILDLLPDSGPVIDGLVSQHERMIEVLQMARIHAERGEPCEVAELRTDLQRFLDTMRAHEKAEEALLERAVEEETRSLT